MNVKFKTKKIKIQEVSLGDYIKSYDVDNDYIEYSRVVDLLYPIVKKTDQRRIVFSDGNSVTTSKYHPILAFRDNRFTYIPTEELVVGDLCLHDSHSAIAVTQIIIPRKVDEQFYDLTVEKNNNYFSGNLKTSLYLVHNSTRRGSASINFPFWHYEAQNLIPLKDSRGTPENRVRAVDYIIQLNKLFYDRFKQGKDITLFCPSQVPDLYDAFFQDQSKFEELYVKYEKKRGLRKKVVGSKELLDLICRVRSETGRLYIMNVDNCNEYGVFNCTDNTDTVRMTNLCTEILLANNPIQAIDDKEGLIALCTLGAINLGKIKQLSDMEPLAKILVRSLDNLIEDQTYPLPAAERFGRDYRALGVGISGLAHYLARNKLKYADSNTLPLIHQTFEAFQYYLLKASNELAQERGVCKAFSTTKYAKGILPIDKYKKTVDEVCLEPLALDWEALRSSIKEFGLRHTVLSAQMPVEKSSIVGNSTNGIEAPRALVSTKNNKTSGNVSVVVPEIEKYKKYYQLVWGEDYSNKAYLNIVAIMQKFLDQAISADIYDNSEYYHKKFQGDRDLMEKGRYKNMVQEIFRAHKLGVKTLYYHTTNDFSSEKHEINTHLENSYPSEDREESCPGGVCTL